MDIPLEISFNVPEGNYRAKLYSVRPTKGDGIRIVFNNLRPLTGYKDFMAGKDYKAKDGKKLAEDFASWLGDDFTVLLTKNRRSIGALDLEQFIGQEADIEVEHFDNRSHAGPYRFIKSINPPRKLVSEDYLDEAA